MSDKRMDTLIAQYRELRDKKKDMEERHKQELAPINEMLAKVDALFLQRLTELGVESIKSKSGTVYKSEKWSASVADWDKVLEHVIEHKAWHLLNRSVSMTACRAAAEEDDPVPGVNLSSVLVVGVRKP